MKLKLAISLYLIVICISTTFNAIASSENAATSRYNVYSDPTGALYLEAPKSFVLIASEINIPLLISKKYGYLQLKLINGVWSIEALTETEWRALSLTAGHSFVSSVQSHTHTYVFSELTS